MLSKCIRLHITNVQVIYGFKFLSGRTVIYYTTPNGSIITFAQREINDSCSSGTFQNCNLGTSECPEVASALVRGIFGVA